MEGCGIVAWWDVLDRCLEWQNVKLWKVVLLRAGQV